jgi:hypothetical protein
MGDWLLPPQRSWGLRSSGILHGVGRHFNWLAVENGTDMFSETSIINCQPKLTDIQEQRRSQAEKCVTVEGTYLFVYRRYRWGFGVLRLPKYNTFVLLLLYFSFVKLSFGRLIVDMLNYKYFLYWLGYVIQHRNTSIYLKCNVMLYCARTFEVHPCWW